MTITSFPSVGSADEDGIVGVGGDLEAESLLLAYRSGIFPWPLNERILAWFAPPERAVLFLDEFHISRKLKREIARGRFTTAIDQNFLAVIKHCAEVTNRGSQGASWITEDIIDAYHTLFLRGVCHSFETYQNERLVGGIYGVQIGRFFSAESSFYRVSNASKVAMIAMVEYLRSQSISWFDCQVLTPFSEGFGAREIPRTEYMRLLSTALSD